MIYFIRICNISPVVEKFLFLTLFINRFWLFEAMTNDFCKTAELLFTKATQRLCLEPIFPLVGLRCDFFKSMPSKQVKTIEPHGQGNNPPPPKSAGSNESLLLGYKRTCEHTIWHRALWVTIWTTFAGGENDGFPAAAKESEAQCKR